MKTLLDFLPLIIFFIVYKLYGIMPATAALVVLTSMVTLFIYVKERHVAAMPLISTALVIVFGIATLFADNPVFLKLKPTILYTLMGLILLIGVYGFKRGFLELILGSAVSMSTSAWHILSLRWGYFFIGLALVNEVVWRSVSTDIWVNF
jgi:intracellular septation protein